MDSPFDAYRNFSDSLEIGFRKFAGVAGALPVSSPQGPCHAPSGRLWEQSRKRDEGGAVRRVIVAEFVSLDGVVEAPDQWHFPYWSEEMGQEIGAAMAAIHSST